MNLAQALRLSPATRLALVGSGGKSTALFQIATQLTSPVLATATTHLATWQLRLANHHITLSDNQEISALARDLPDGIILFTGPASTDERVSGLDESTLKHVLSLADARQIPLLIEADGSRQLPLKAPAEYEPAMPAFVDIVVVVAGLTGLGKPLNDQWVHRPERFAALAGLSPGEPITLEGLARVLTDPLGGLKNVPVGARRVALLNQADTLELQSQAQILAGRLLPAFQAVVIAALNPMGRQLAEPGFQTTNAAPERLAGSKDEPAGQRPVLAVYEPVAGIVLAAGGSRRLGEPKQLLNWRGQPLVRHVASAALRGGLSPVVVVTGAQRERVEATIQDLPVRLAYNPDWEAGQSTSIQTGLRLLPPDTGAAIFLLADQPQAPVTLLRALVERHAATLSPVVVPLAGGRRANPALFDRITFPDFFSIHGDTGGRVLFSRYPINWLEWHDESILLDVDTDEDYRRLLALDS